MKKLKSVSIAVALLSLASCSTSSGDRNEEVCNIAIDLNAANAKPSDFFDGWHYTALETSDDSFFGNIEQFAINDSTIIIGSGGNVFLFDRDGKFQKKFTHKGQGPGEYSEIDDLKIIDDKIVILCRSYRKLLYYGFGGNYVKTDMLPGFYENFDSYQNSDIYLANNGSVKEGYEFYEYSVEKEDTVAALLECNEEYFNHRDFKPFLGKGKDCLYASTMYDHTVYKITGDTIYPIVSYDFNTALKLSDLKGKPAMQKMEMTLGKEFIPFLGLFMKLDDGFIQSFTMGGNSYFIFKRHGHRDYLIDVAPGDYPEYPFLVSKPLLFQDGNYISCLSPYSVRFIEDRHNLELVPDSELNDDSNPIIVFHHFKD